MTVLAVTPDVQQIQAAVVKCQLVVADAPPLANHHADANPHVVMDVLRLAASHPVVVKVLVVTAEAVVSHPAAARLHAATHAVDATPAAASHGVSLYRNCSLRFTASCTDEIAAAITLVLRHAANHPAAAKQLLVDAEQIQAAVAKCRLAVTAAAVQHLAVAAKSLATHAVAIRVAAAANAAVAC